ncbi:MAG: hypothetical protein JW931_09500 [Methanomicrobiaceae archaeon]|nr:hypothetical protein [Methanomicrobiaceae archaeon]
MGDSKDPDSQENLKWIMYHLVALDYSHEKYSKKINELTEQKKLKDANSSELRSIIQEIKKISSWYQDSLQTHQTKAINHIPEGKRKKWEKEFRDKENKSCFNLYVEDQKPDFDLSINAFKKGSELKK